MADLMAAWFWRRSASGNMALDNRRIPLSGGDIDVRIYVPETTGPHPVIVYFHGLGLSVLLLQL